MFEYMKFTGLWRDYQQRVLNELDDHLDDKKLHIVAAPGSGKTVLGIEVMRRLAHKTIILSPSLTIRNQWADRLHELFLDKGTKADVSYNLRQPTSITSTTYQSLHSLWANEYDDKGKNVASEFDALIARFNSEDSITIIVDEAHHLRREWWRALNEFVSSLTNATIVALTATPPYDASFAEWTRYDDLCGPIDAEISVPELVRNGDLCPHQDYIHFSIPEQSELEIFTNRRKAMAYLITELIENIKLHEALLAHQWVVMTMDHEDNILDDPEFLSSMLILLNETDNIIPKAPMKMLGVARNDIPAFSLPWLEIFLNGFLFGYRGHFEAIESYRKGIEKYCRKAGLIENNCVKLLESKSLLKLVASSLAKLNSISEIAKAEYGNLGDDLRMVVLTDYVRAADLPSKADDIFKPTKLGVAPIFEMLRRTDQDGPRLGVLTGTLVIVPSEVSEHLEQVARQIGLDITKIRISPLKACPGYSKLSIEGMGNQKKVALVTHLFGAGSIQILVGTQSLLGEGWDAPTINSLILASNVGSYMLSNQMRGRAIRIDPLRPDKVANIWHLATIEPQAEFSSPNLLWDSIDSIGQRYLHDLSQLGGDIRLLIKRFKVFECISNGQSDVISNGIDRLNISERDWQAHQVASKNHHILQLAFRRDEVRSKWQRSLGDAAQRSHVKKVAETDYAPRKQSYSQTLQYLSISSVLGAITSSAGMMRQFQSVSSLATLMMIFGGITFLISLPKLFKVTRLFIRNGTLERSLNQVCLILIDGLHHAGLMKYDRHWYEISIEKNIRGKHFITLKHASRAEEKIFFEALGEILGPVINPRYLLIRKSWLGKWLRQDYHAVPTALGTHKEQAEYFAKLWNDQIGFVKLIYMRQKSGRKLLLKARSSAMSSGFQRYVDQRSEWR